MLELWFKPGSLTERSEYPELVGALSARYARLS